MNADAGSRLHSRAHRRNSGAMSGHARHVATLRPASVAVHDDRDVLWEPRWIKLPVNFAFLAIQTGGNFCLQAIPFRFTKLTQWGRGTQWSGSVHDRKCTWI